MFDRLNTIVRYIIIGILLLPFVFIIPFLPANLYFGILSFHLYVYLSFMLLLFDNDFDCIKCPNCGLIFLEYDNFCFNCGLANNFKNHV